MEQALTLTTQITTVIMWVTGIFVLTRGDWRTFMLKYAAVAISTVAAIWLCAMLILFGETNCSTTNSFCVTWKIYGIARNIAIILFHVSVGRDAIEFKHHDRRQAWRKK